MTHLAPVAQASLPAPFVPLAANPAPAIVAVAEALQPDLAQGLQIDALRLRHEMEHAFGGSDATGAWDWKLAYEAGEVALILFLRKFGRALLARAGSPAALLPILAKVAGLLPTHTRRSAEMERFQQFSTPMPMGLAALAAAQITPFDLVLEPSAGTGLLAILAEIAGGGLALNELADTRADLLRLLFPGRPVTTFDAAQIDDHLDVSSSPSVILMNPPFSAQANVDGRSTEATARHLRSALARLAPGGRLVAITGAGFAPDAPAWAETFGRLTETAHLIFTGAVSGAAFARHGTGFETRISVFDKCRGGEPGDITADLRQPLSPDVAHLMSRITAEVPPRLELEQAANAGLGHSSRFPGNSHLTTRKPASRSHATSAANPAKPETQIEAEELDYALRDAAGDEDAARLSDAIYETFRLQAIDIPGAAPHPTKLVQSAAMASVAPPKPTYRPKLPPAVLRDGLLSDSQLETVIYAGEAHGARLAGSWTVDETGDVVSAAPEGAADAVRFRRGFFLGDGTGAGKGRQSAGILLDNWCQGRRKALWISKSDKLLEDAQRDWSALGQERLLVTPLSRFAQGRDIPLTEGILFTTYATLRSEERGAKKSRVDQIVDWLGSDFDGVVLFDESHAMANAAGGKGERGDTMASQQGRAGLRLQHKLPNARVVYVSATGATTVHNLAYAQRLGLWGGEDFPFATRGEFVEAIEAGGVAAMEVLARDLRSLGLYTARSLSYARPNLSEEHLARLDDGEVAPKLAEALQGTGIDAEAVAARLREGAGNAALERQWLAQDLQGIAKASDLDLEKSADREEALDRLEAVHVRLGDVLTDVRVLRAPTEIDEVDNAEPALGERLAAPGGDLEKEGPDIFAPSERQAFRALVAQFRRTDFDHPFSDDPSVRRAGAVEVEEARVAFDAYAQRSPQHAELASMAWDQMTDSRMPPQYAVSEQDRTLHAGDMDLALRDPSDHLGPITEELRTLARYRAEMPDDEFGAAVQYEINHLRALGASRAYISERSLKIEDQARQDYAERRYLEETAPTVMAFVRNADVEGPLSESEQQDIVRQINERLSHDAIDALRAGNADVLDTFTEDPLRQLGLAKTYLQSSEVTAHGPAMERVLDALAEEQIEAQRARHAAAHGEKGITHG